MMLAFHHGPRPQWRWKLVSLLVRWRTRGKFDHVEVEFSDFVTASASISHGGVKFVPNKVRDRRHWEFVYIPADEQRVRQWFEDHCDAKFDTWGVLGFLTGWSKGNDDYWFCSEAVAAALGYPNPWRFDPNTLHAVVTRGLAA